MIASRLGARAPAVHLANRNPIMTTTYSDLRVLTWNLYLGADATWVLGAAAEDLPKNSTILWDIVCKTDFPTRAVGMARRIRDELPDVLALQEVYRWTHRGPNGRTVRGIDFLALLQEALAAQGLDYEVVVNRRGLSATLPLVDKLGTVHLEDGVCLLVRRNGDQAWRAASTRSGDFQANLWSSIGKHPFEVRRGWCSARLVRVRDSKLESVSVVNTHLEAYAREDEPWKQVVELINGPLASAGRVVAIGDFNLKPANPAIRHLLRQGFHDAWAATQGAAPGYTSCQDEELRNEESELFERIDYVFPRGLSTLTTRLIGATPQDGRPDGLWLSDHAALAADLCIDRETGGEV